MDLLLRDFFFIRHGQTDHNAGKVSEEHIDISLNAFGQSQARLIEPTIAKLPIQTICYSPLKRAVETKEIISRNFAVPHKEIADLSECSIPIWTQMTACKSNTPCHSKREIQFFIQRVKRGINFALKEHGPVLIVAHGGVYWAICHLLSIHGEGTIDNCIPVHFSVRNNGKWSAKKMIQDFLIAHKPLKSLRPTVNDSFFGFFIITNLDTDIRILVLIVIITSFFSLIELNQDLFVIPCRDRYI